MPSNPLVSVLLNMAANSKKRNKDMTTEATPVPTELDNPLDASHNARDGKHLKELILPMSLPHSN